MTDEWTTADQAMLELDIEGIDYSDVTCKDFVQRINRIEAEES